MVEAIIFYVFVILPSLVPVFVIAMLIVEKILTYQARKKIIVDGREDGYY